VATARSLRQRTFATPRLSQKPPLARTNPASLHPTPPRAAPVSFLSPTVMDSQRFSRLQPVLERRLSAGGSLRHYRFRSCRSHQRGPRHCNRHRAQRRALETGADVVHFDHIDAFLSGYESFRPLSEREAEAIGALLPLVHAEFALSETDYFIRVLRSPQKAEVAYKTFLLGHANWFLTDAGKRLREHLSRWASGRPQSAARENQSVPAAVKRDVQR